MYGPKFRVARTGPVARAGDHPRLPVGEGAYEVEVEMFVGSVVIVAPGGSWKSEAAGDDE